MEIVKGNLLVFKDFEGLVFFNFRQIANIYSQITIFALSFVTKHGRDEFIDSQTRYLKLD